MNQALSDLDIRPAPQAVLLVVMTMSTAQVADRQAVARTVAVARELDGLSHPVRLRVVLAIDNEDASPSTLAARLEAPLGTVSYHVRCLAALGLLELVASHPRRGALEHVYALTPRGRVLRRLALQALRADPPE
jgi:DNA-binding transcriptional ArsR family regulator